MTETRGYRAPRAERTLNKILPESSNNTTSDGENPPPLTDVFSIPCHQEETSFTKANRADWIRTSDLLTPSQTRYQTALRPEMMVCDVGYGNRHTSEYCRTPVVGQPKTVSAERRSAVERRVNQPQRLYNLADGVRHLARAIGRRWERQIVGSFCRSVG